MKITRAIFTAGVIITVGLLAAPTAEAQPAGRVPAVGFLGWRDTDSRLPIMVAEADATAWNGAVLRFGPNTTGMPARAAEFVDRILRGAKPAELPVEQPTKYGLVVDLRAAKTLGLTIPPSLLGRANQVIE